MERSFEEARRIVEATDNKTLVEKRSISVPLIKEILGNY
jgi:hypothetical protein